MGGGSTQSGTTSGSSSGSGNFASNPLNVSNPPLFDLGSAIASGLRNLIGNYNTGGTSNPAGTMGISPYYGDPSGNGSGFYSANDTARNPLVADTTPQQNNFLGGIGQNPYGPSASTAVGATNMQNATAQNNPYLQAGGAAGGATTAFGQNPGNFGGGAAGAAGSVAGSILPNAQPALAAGTQTALGSPYGGAAANQAINTAQNSGFGTGLASQAGQYATNSGFGTGTAANAAQYANQQGFGTGSAAQASQFASSGQGLNPSQSTLLREMDPSFAYNTTVNPFTSGLVGAAEQPILNAFNQQTVPGLQGVFTAAGQRVNSAGTGVGGSSAFDMAGTNALTGLEGQLGATAASIYNPIYNTALGISAQAPTQYAAGQQQLLSGLESAAQTKLQTQTGKEQALQGAAQTKLATQTGKEAALTSAAQTKASTTATQIASLDQAALSRLQVTTGKTANELAAAAAAGTLTAQESAALTAASGAQTGAGTAQANAMTSGGALSSQVGSAENTGLSMAAQNSQGLNTSLMDNTIKGLNASALPQMTRQYGINQALSLYNQQIQQMSTLLGVGAQAAQPTIGNASFGLSTSSGTSQGNSSGKGFSIL